MQQTAEPPGALDLTKHLACCGVSDSLVPDPLVRSFGMVVRQI